MLSLLLSRNFMPLDVVRRSGSMLWLKSLGAAVCLLMTGCVGMHQGSFTAVPDDQSERVLESLRLKETAIRQLRGLFQASVSGAGIPFSQRFNGMMSYDSPDRVHLRGFLRFGVPMMDFHREGNAYTLYFPAENETITGQVNGPPTQTQWDQTVQLSVRALDAVLGKISSVSQGEIRVLKGETHYRLDMADRLETDQATQQELLVRAWVDTQTLALTEIEYRRATDDEVLVSVQCEDYRTVTESVVSDLASIQLPFVVTATDHRSNGGSITLTFQEFVLNAA